MLFDENFQDNGIQICKFDSDSLILISVYRSQYGNIGTLLESLLSLIRDECGILIMGDFNVCNMKKPNNAIKASLIEQGFKLLIEESTQIMGGHIDHAYWRDNKNIYEEPEIERHSVYYSDHDALCVSLKRK